MSAPGTEQTGMVALSSQHETGCEQVHQVRFERHIAMGLPFLTEGQKSKGNSKKQAQRLRRVSPCFSYNWHYSFKNNRIFACTSEAIIKTIN
ncbi:hypothetical protein D9F60_23765 [Escherichia coli]|nr:hypothetical protein [Escherichia coli]MHU45451.1 hypothetical protein [Escherichia coli]